MLQGHYSIKKGAAFLGIGMENVIPVKTDNKGRMSPTALETAIQECQRKVIIKRYIVRSTRRGRTTRQKDGRTDGQRLSSIPNTLQEFHSKHDLS